MIVVSRARDESMMIGDDIRVTVVDIRGDKVRLGFTAPTDLSIHREEVYQAIRRENERAERTERTIDLTQRRLHAAPRAFKIRIAKVTDLEAINRIYNHYVVNSACTYQEEPSTPEERAAWFAGHGPRHPVTVAERDGEVVGWGSLSKFHPRSAYGKTVENSVYVRKDSHRQGIGAALLGDLLERGKAIGHHSVMALIDSQQRGSVALHEKFGFVEVGRLREVGFKFGRPGDVIYMQRML
jgi:phosphinothricin acetyltransferase